MLSDEQRAEFDRTGIVKLEGAFTDADAARMRDIVWYELERRHGITRDDRSTWNRSEPTGMRTARKHRAFAPTVGPALRGALDGLFGPDQWRPPKHYGQVLITMPNATEWRVPDRVWHSDFQYYSRPELLFAVKYWVLFDRVEAGGGGTLQLAGSHRLTTRFIAGRSHDDLEYKRVRDGLLRSHPWLHALSTPDDDPCRNERFMGADADIEGIPARVVELTGEPGDIYVTHPWVMHCIAPNARSEPRLMRSMAIVRDYANAGITSRANSSSVAGAARS